MSMTSGVQGGMSQVEGLISQGTMNTSVNNMTQISVMGQSGYDPSNNTKIPQKPFYIVSPDSSILSAFKVLTGLLSMPSVAFYLFIIAFGFGNDWITQLAYWTELFYGIEILLNFITSFKDLETFQTVTSLKRVAQNYVLNGSFFLDVVAFFPYWMFFREVTELDPFRQNLRNLLLLKLIRVYRVGNNFIPEKSVADLIMNFYEPDSRDEKIAQDRQISNLISTLNQVITIIIATYILGLVWYRLSDYMLRTWGIPQEPEERYWVVRFSLRRPSCEHDLDEIDPLREVLDRLVICLYYMLTTLSTVGYGDLYPYSISEKIVGSLIQIIGVTLFSIVMNAFIKVVMTLKDNSFRNNEDLLQRWFVLIKKIRNQPFGEGKDIPVELRQQIETHFRYFWEHDRTAVLLEKKEYFDSIPFKIQDHIMCQFLFEDILKKTAFHAFFRSGKEFDSNFAYEIAFGFMPREFLDTPGDRYMYEEEGDVTEIYFIMKGEWGIAFDSFTGGDHIHLDGENFDEMQGSSDMQKRGILIAQRKVNYGYIGDYYVLASKRSQFYYVALTAVHAFALTKQFMFKQLFKKFPGLHSEMMAESFSRYLREFRKPYGKKRNEIISKLNRKKQYSQINLENSTAAQTKANIRQKLTRDTSTKLILDKGDELRNYKAKLEGLNQKANTMFEHMKQINKLVNKKIVEIESAVTKSEQIFTEEISTLMAIKTEMKKMHDKNYTRKD